MRSVLKLAAGFMLLNGVSLAAPPAKPMGDQGAGDVAVAERLAQMAQTLLSSSAINSASLHQSAALFEEASRLDPSEERFLRLLTEAYLQLGGDEGRDGAISSLNRYLQIEPTDLSAQARVIDLHAGAFNSTDEEKKYVDQLLATDQLAAEVRSHVAVLASKLSSDRGENEAAVQYIQQALDLFPLNPEALRAKYTQTSPDAPLVERAALFVQMLRSNPAQPAIMENLAQACADAGLVDASLRWHQQYFNLAARLTRTPTPQQWDNYAAELIVADQLKAADGVTAPLIQQDAGNVDAALLGALIAKRGGNPDRVNTANDLARNAIKLNLSAISDHFNRRPTTQPIDKLDIAEDVKAITAAQDQSANDYTRSLADLAWVEIYFANKPADAQPYIDAIKQLGSDQDGTISARLEGWQYLVDNKENEAKVKLSAVADRDAYSGLGMIQIESKNMPPERIVGAVKRLLAQYPSGVVGATLIESLRNKIGLMPAGPQAPAVTAELDKLPRDWMGLLDNTQVKTIYALKAEPVKVAHGFGEPILAKITITNTSNFDITIGPDGALRPDVWIDAQIKGITQKYLSGVAFERMGMTLLLHPKESISQTMRVDQDGLATMLEANPAVGLPLYFAALTNPAGQSGGVAPGPGGYRVQFTSVVERSASPVTPKALSGYFDQLATGPADDRVRTLELLTNFARVAMEHGDEKQKSQATETLDLIRKSTGDPVESVRAEAAFAVTLLSDKDVRIGLVRQMLASDSSSQRFFGLLAAQLAYPTDERKSVAKPLAENDADPIVKQLAQSVIELADVPTTQPTSGPATQPDNLATP